MGAKEATEKERAEEMFKLSFETDNAAFEEDRPSEIARMLREIAGKVDAGETDGKIRDVNGNTIGEWELK